jgi:ABC-type phosphate/phosphonate transport system substrate-binding protein
MYDWPEVEWAHDTFWRAVARRLNAAGIAAPDELERSRSYDVVWRDPGLVLSQTCGLPFSTRLRGMVKLVAVPIYRVAGCAGAHYSSMIVTRRNEPAEEIRLFAGRRFAYNGADSLSGFVVLKSAMKEAGLDPKAADWIETGSHRASVRAVAAGAADIAAIDAVCWGLALRHEAKSAAALKVIAETPLRPGLPLITAVERSDDEIATIRAVLKDALADPATGKAREALQMTGIGTFDEWDYSPIAALAQRLA